MAAAGPFRYRVRGRVQGVGFRWFVMGVAERLGLESHTAHAKRVDIEHIAE